MARNASRSHPFGPRKKRVVSGRAACRCERIWRGITGLKTKRTLGVTLKGIDSERSTTIGVSYRLLEPTGTHLRGMQPLTLGRPPFIFPPAIDSQMDFPSVSERFSPLITTEDRTFHWKRTFPCCGKLERARLSFCRILSIGLTRTGRLCMDTVFARDTIMFLAISLRVNLYFLMIFV